MKNLNKIKDTLKERRVKRVRAKIFGTQEKPRIAVFKSLKHISVQAINDENGTTIVSSTDKEVKAKTRQEIATEVGNLLLKNY